jgi:uncharacterized damage-inducible protein DinB
MRVEIGLENGVEGRSLSWALDHPGCFAYGKDGPEAIVAMGRAVPDYIEWLNRHTSQNWFNPVEIDIRLVDTWQVYTIDPEYNRANDGYEVNAWFLSDWKPLTGEEIQHGRMILAWTRQELIELVSNLRASVLDRAYEGERWSIRGILHHVAVAEWWYLSQLGLTRYSQEDLPEDTFTCLSEVRLEFNQVLTRMEGLEKVIGRDGEFWSQRKLLRRAAWLERDHIQHNQRLLSENS